MQRGALFNTLFVALFDAILSELGFLVVAFEIGVKEKAGEY